MLVLHQLQELAEGLTLLQEGVVRGGRGAPHNPLQPPCFGVSQTWHLLGIGDCPAIRHWYPAPVPTPTRAQGLNPALPHPYKGPCVPHLPQLSITHPGTDKNKVFPLRFILFLLKNDAQFVLHPL